MEVHCVKITHWPLVVVRIHCSYRLTAGSWVPRVQGGKSLCLLNAQCSVWLWHSLCLLCCAEWRCCQWVLSNLSLSVAERKLSTAFAPYCYNDCHLIKKKSSCIERLLKSKISSGSLAKHSPWSIIMLQRRNWMFFGLRRSAEFVSSVFVSQICATQTFQMDKFRIDAWWF